METDAALFLLAKMLIAVAKIAAPVLLATLVVGFVISLIQVVTQIQEMTLTYVPKLIVAGLVFALFGHWMLDTAKEFTLLAFEFAAAIR